MKLFVNTTAKHLSTSALFAFKEYKNIHPIFNEFWSMQCKLAPIIALATGGVQYIMTSTNMLNIEDLKFYLNTLGNIDKVLDPNANLYLKEMEINELRNCLIKLTSLASHPGAVQQLIDADVPEKVSHILTLIHNSPSRNISLESLCIDVLYLFSGIDGNTQAHKKSLPVLQSILHLSKIDEYNNWKQDLSNIYWDQFLKLRMDLSDQFNNFLLKHEKISDAILQKKDLANTNEAISAKRHWRNLKKMEGIICSLITSKVVSSESVDLLINDLIEKKDYRFMISILDSLNKEGMITNSKKQIWNNTILSFDNNNKSNQFNETIISNQEKYKQKVLNIVQIEDNQSTNSYLTTFKSVNNLSTYSLGALLILTPLWIRFRYKSIFGFQVSNRKLLFYQGVGAIQIYLMWKNFKFQVDPRLEIILFSILHAYLFVFARFMILPISTLEGFKMLNLNTLNSA